jgi:ketosteroid isomerase-like protein
MNAVHEKQISQQEVNKTIARRWLELISQNDIKALCDMTAPTWTMHGGPPNLPRGEAAVHELFRTIGPVKQTWTVEDMIAEGDKVVVRAINHCTQESFFGVDAGGIEQVFSATFIHQIKDGKVTETWRNADDLGRLFQLGAEFSQKGK